MQKPKNNMEKKCMGFINYNNILQLDFSLIKTFKRGEY